ncbi:ferredoxin [Streptomyces sioyaensis]|uniref:ferredoxin n=1 Tax=Streptomyces sioyaensis TaxID=67364 RepID=UPI0037BC55D5
MKITLAADTGLAARRVPIVPAVFDRRDEDGVVVPPDAAPPTQRQDAVRGAAGSPAAVTEVRA